MEESGRRMSKECASAYRTQIMNLSLRNKTMLGIEIMKLFL